MNRTTRYGLGLILSIFYFTYLMQVADNMKPTTIAVCITGIVVGFGMLAFGKRG